MKVNPSGSNPVQGSEVSGAKKTDKAEKSQKAKSTNASAEAAASSGAVKADISARGKEFARAKEVAGAAPDVREEKIAELKRRIAAGKYGVDADAVADKLVDDHIQMNMNGMS